MAYAAESGCLAVAKVLIEAGAAVEVAHDYFTVGPLLRAAWQRHAEVIDYLLRQGAKVNSKSRLGDTPLTAAIAGTVFSRGARGDRDEAIQVLLKHKADVNLAGRNGWTPLIYAVFQEDVALVRLLISNGANISAKDDNGKTALDHARNHGEGAVLESLERVLAR